MIDPSINPTGLHIRPASPNDLSVLRELVGFEFFVHRHLDWNPPLDWIAQKPFFILEHGSRILAAMACPEDPPQVAWIHLYVTNSEYKPQQTFPPLLKANLEYLRGLPQVNWIAAISLNTWFTTLMQENGFQHYQDIVVLERDLSDPLPQNKHSFNFHLRSMELDDLPAVAEVDRAAFHPLWQNTQQVLTEAWHQRGYATVVEQESQIIGYQICTSSYFNAHLARLAVIPGFQKQGLGRLIIEDLSNHFFNQGISHLTVNTQSDNHSSLALYRKMGFELSGDNYPVFIYPQAFLRI